MSRGPWKTRPVCRCEKRWCRKCMNRAAVERYRERKHATQYADEDARIDMVIQQEYARQESASA